MPTHSIGPGTCNLSVNVPKPVHRMVGREAFKADMSMGAFVRWALRRVGVISQTASEAEKADREALRVAREAQSPDSEGGVNITPAEAVAFMELVARSADRDRELHQANAAS